MDPLVSILIPAFNAQDWIAETIRSAIAQTWQRKEIIIVDDGSTDQTLAIARRFISPEVTVVTQVNQGAAAARNHAYALSRGDYIQWLDADDLLAPDKIAKQIDKARQLHSSRILFSAGWGHFFYRTGRAKFVPSALWCDLSPIEWLMRKMGRHVHMQTATWLVSRELTEAAGPWDVRLWVDDDGEYFCRVILASDEIRFVPGSKVFYRMTASGRLSHVGTSDRKKDALSLSMQLHVKYIRSLEESGRVRAACKTYLQRYLYCFYPERPDLVAEVEELATSLGYKLKQPRLRWKYAWIKPLFGWGAAKAAQNRLPQIKGALLRSWDKAMYKLEKYNQVKNWPGKGSTECGC
jgi:glycosyltransferase involved in cell wall biosynthesis